MNPILLLKAAPWIIAAILAAGVALMTHMYMKERDAFTAFRTEIKLLGDQAQAEKTRIEAQYEANLKKVQASYENQIPAIRSGAVANYKLRYPNTSFSCLSDAPAGQQVANGASQECLPDPAFIANAADDAAKVEAWRSWAALNNVPVE